MDKIVFIYHALQQCAVKITRNRFDADELLHHTIEYCIVHSKDKIDAMTEKELYSYLHRAMYLGWYSKSSSFRQLFKLNTTDLNLDNIEMIQQVGMHDRIKVENVDIAMSRLPEHERIIFEEYLLPDFSYEYWSGIAGVDVSYMYKYVNHIKSKIKKYVVRIERNH
jgi:DNA-directed RNA polymerase specialized sigma24 family protein